MSHVKHCVIVAALLAAASSTGSAQVLGGEDYFGSRRTSPGIYSPQGEFLGSLNHNQFDPDSVSNPFGKGSQFDPRGVNNPFSPNYSPGIRRQYGPR